ncbi:hypothetical protein BPAE_0082g00210 [Botrytis paeoniae]|uniref:Uncharacterized protein n=1 Tax=Botrytis paeoniae TaxID=278948 RepID=A0A4Z1FKU4_9HELO|nr:hypothetical protein BPAE_0082g00210 [Botrytis paeoniae]
MAEKSERARGIGKEGGRDRKMQSHMYGAAESRKYVHLKGIVTNAKSSMEVILCGSFASVDVDFIRTALFKHERDSIPKGDLDQLPRYSF